MRRSAFADPTCFGSSDASARNRIATETLLNAACGRDCFACARRECSWLTVALRAPREQEGFGCGGVRRLLLCLLAVCQPRASCAHPARAIPALPWQAEYVVVSAGVSQKAQRERHPRKEPDVQRPIQAMVRQTTTMPGPRMYRAQRSCRLQRLALGKHFRLLFSVVDAVRGCRSGAGGANERRIRCRRN